MRIHFPHMSRPKQAAKKIASKLERVPLSKVQAVLAVALGYRDWHELNTSHAKHSPTPLDETWSPQQAKSFYLNAALRFMEIDKSSPSNVVAAIAASRMAGARNWARDDHSSILFAAWRQQEIIGSKRRSLGSVVRITGRSTKEFGYLCHFNNVAHVLYDGGYRMCADFEVVTPRLTPADFLPARLWRPYGYWTLKDGAEVVFSRDYLPLWYVSGQEVTRIPPWLRIKGIQSEYHFGGPLSGHWMNLASETEAVGYLNLRGIHQLPMLADAFPDLIGIDNANVKAGVAKLLSRYPQPDPDGPWKRQSVNELQ